MKIVVRNGDKGGGGGDFEIQVFSTASNLPNELGTEPRFRTLDRHEKRTNLSLKLVKNEESFMRGTADAWFSVRQGLSLAYWTNSPEAPHRLSACEESEYAIVRLPYFTGAAVWSDMRRRVGSSEEQDFREV